MMLLAPKEPRAGRRRAYFYARRAVRYEQLRPIDVTNFDSPAHTYLEPRTFGRTKAHYGGERLIYKVRFV